MPGSYRQQSLGLEGAGELEDDLEFLMVAVRKGEQIREDLGHGFHETLLGVRYTISSSASDEALDCLLALNHERYEEEVWQGLHEKKRRGARILKESEEQYDLFWNGMCLRIQRRE